MKSWNETIQDMNKYRDAEVHACNCVGPQNGQPKCPCMMKSVRIIDGEYVQITRLGKVK